MNNHLSSLPLSLYIHIPWCVRKCPYCDFNSHGLKDAMPEEKYIECLIQDFVFDLKTINNRPLVSIFFGGGTPSLFSPHSIKIILDEIKHRIEFIPNIEITLEANPGTVEQSRFEGFLDAGVNRLSLGCQSFNAEKLKALGRIHNQDEAINAVNAAKKAGFTNINLDLMFGLPKQTITEGLQDLQTAIDLNPTHISWYHLTLEPNTLFYHEPPSLPQDETIWQLQETGQKLLHENGFMQYEISAYAKDNLQCQHNLNYWQFGDYLGIGAGAHGKITDTQNQQIIRTMKLKHPKQYLSCENNFIAEQRIVSTKELPFEFMLNTLRLKQNISIHLFEQRTGLSFSVIENVLKKAEKKDLIKISDEHFYLTDLGFRFVNDVVEMFL